MKKVIIAILLILCLGMLAACSGKDDNTEAAEYVYNEFELDKGNDSVDCAYLKGNDFYYVSYLYPDMDDDAALEEWEEWKGSLHQYKIDSGEDIVLFDVKSPNDIHDLYVTEQNQIKILYNSYTEGFRGYTIYTKTPDGADAGSVSLSDNVNAALEESVTIEEAYFERDEQIYLSCKELESGKMFLVRCDIGGNVTGSVKIDDYMDINGVFLDKDKKLAMETSSAEGLSYMYIDFDKGECLEKVDIQNEENEFIFTSEWLIVGYASRIYNGYGDDSCYIRDITGLCSYNASEQKITYLLDWTKTGIIGSYVNNILPLEEGKFFCECRDMRYGERNYGIIEELGDGKERKVIKCAILNMENDNLHSLEKIIINYNKSNPDYRVELVSYDKSYSPISAFAKDVISGNIPDVLDISGVDVKSYISQGFFEDLAPYMERDNEFGKDYYIDGLYNAIAVDGKQYYAVKNFSLDTIAAKESDTERYKDGWTIYDMIEYYNSKPEGTLLNMYETKKDMFEILVAPFIDDYIDWNTGKVSFDSDDFRAAVEFCGRFPSSCEIWPDYREVNKMIREGKILTNDLSIVSVIRDFSYNKALFDQDIRFIGFPSADKRKALIIPSSSSLAITSSSNEKDAAWDFVKSVITDDTQSKFEDGAGLPSGKEQFERVVKRLTATEKYTEEDGTIIRPLSSSSGMNEFSYSIRPISEEEINMIRHMIKNAAVKTDNSEILLIMESVLNDYFDGRKTLDELVSVLQDRVGKYVNENR